VVELARELVEVHRAPSYNVGIRLPFLPAIQNLSGVVMKNWWNMSKRLRRFLFHSQSVFGYKWIEECGHWKVLVVRIWDVYKAEW